MGDGSFFLFLDSICWYSCWGFSPLYPWGMSICRLFSHDILPTNILAALRNLLRQIKLPFKRPRAKGGEGKEKGKEKDSLLYFVYVWRFKCLTWGIFLPVSVVLIVASLYFKTGSTTYCTGVVHSSPAQESCPSVHQTCGCGVHCSPPGGSVSFYSAKADFWEVSEKTLWILYLHSNLRVAFNSIYS